MMNMIMTIMIGQGLRSGGIHNTHYQNTYVHNTYGLKIPTCVFQNTYRPYHNTYKLFQNTYQHFQALSKYLQAFSKYLPKFSGPIKIPTEISGLIKKLSDSTRERVWIDS